MISAHSQHSFPLSQMTLPDYPSARFAACARFDISRRGSAPPSSLPRRAAGGLRPRARWLGRPAGAVRGSARHRVRWPGPAHHARRPEAHARSRSRISRQLARAEVRCGGQAAVDVFARGPGVSREADRGASARAGASRGRRAGECLRHLSRPEPRAEIRAGRREARGLHHCVRECSGALPHARTGLRRGDRRREASRRAQLDGRRRQGNHAHRRREDDRHSARARDDRRGRSWPRTRRGISMCWRRSTRSTNSRPKANCSSRSARKPSRGRTTARS